MKKEIAQRLNTIADHLPLVYEEQEDFVLMPGKELNLTPIGDAMRLEPERMYEVPIPKFVAVFHRQQVKDEYKRGGLEAVKSYMKSVWEKFYSGERITLAV